MERILKAGGLQQIGGKLLRAILIIFFTYLISRVPLSGGYFSAAIGLFAYLVSRNTLHLYLVVPAIAAILPYFPRGYDAWGEVAALCVCGLIFVSGRKLRMAVWHQSIISAAVTIVCVSIYRLATATVYQLTVAGLIGEAVLVFCFFHLFDAFFNVLERRKAGGPGNRTGEPAAYIEAAGFLYGNFAKHIELLSLPVIGLLLICGAGLDFLIWPAIVFLALAGLSCVDLAQAVMMVSAAGCFAALAGQEQWGFLLTILIALCLGTIGRQINIPMGVALFATACAVFSQIKSGLILGVDVHCLVIAIAAFSALYWRFGKELRGFFRMFAAVQEFDRGHPQNQIEWLLQAQAREMETLAELYGTYVDRRAALANQFRMTQQMLETLQWEMTRPAKLSQAAAHEKFEVQTAVAQYAASGTINGDCCGWQDIGHGKTALILSDGMGKGKKAASESLMVSRTILTLLKSGVTTELALKMMNTIMMIKEDEDSFATVDLAIIDRRSGKARFYKIGAAPTLLRRKEHVEELRLSAVPLGIVNGLRIDFVEVVLKRGDWIIMMSDGVSDGGSGKGLLREISEIAVSIRSEDPQIMCDLILDQAADSYIGKERDDLSVMVAHV